MNLNAAFAIGNGMIKAAIKAITKPYSSEKNVCKTNIREINMEIVSICKITLSSVKLYLV